MKKFEQRHPLVATLIHRSITEFYLVYNAAAERVKAIQSLHACRNLAPRVDDFGEFETHHAYEARLRTDYRGRRAFWARIARETPNE